MRRFAKRFLDRVMWSLACVVALALINGQVAGQCEFDKLLASDGAANDKFGFSVSISGDIAIVGRWIIFGSVTDSGSAYIFRFNGVSWVEEQKLLASDSAIGDRFGWSVSISDTPGNEVAIVGADLDDNSGSAYIFRFNGVSWVEEAKLLASDGGVNDSFGQSVSISGAPGNEVAIVGAYLDDDNGADSGSAYIYRKIGGGWVEEAKLLASDGAASDRFGYSVSISGVAAIVGAYFDDDNGFNSGSAYIYRFNGVTWVEEQNLLASDGAVNDYFGYSVSISGIPGNEVAIVGAYLDDDNGVDSGSAYIYRFNGPTWVEEQKLLASDGALGDGFGISASISGSAPGNEIAIVGAWFGGGNEVNSGSAYIYRFNGATWVEEQKLLASDGASGDRFGVSVSISDTPGNEIAIVGSYFDDDNGTDSGSAYVYGGLSDCNSNGILDCLDLSAGTSSDINGNFRPDECESFAFNLTQGTNHDTILDAIDAAFDGDQLFASSSRFPNESSIDFDNKELSLTSLGDLIQSGGFAEIVLADGATLAAADGRNMSLGGILTVLFGDRVSIEANQIDISGLAVFSAGTVIAIEAPAGLTNFGTLIMVGGDLGVSNAFTNAPLGTMEMFGTIQLGVFANQTMTNDGAVTITADTQLLGDYVNNANTTVQNGTLTIFGTLTNNGTLTGDVAGGSALKASAAAPSGLSVLGDFVAGSAARILLPLTDKTFGVEGDFDVAINDSANYDMAQAELRMIGLAGAVQILELMSLDIGADSDGLDRSFAGHYPIGTLRIGPSATTVTLVDNHDNANDGQLACEALYIETLIVNAGATLNTNGCRVYYETLQLDGMVDDPLNLIALPLCLADVNDDNSVNVTDLLSLLGAWGPCGAPCSPDINTDGNVNVTDLLALLGSWGACP